ncbi:hypothetical protein [Aquibacillus kalidii]|uniref:hypothetical protein n=1 Tax=Aquibacillus kalidii TaxID=2762597 RepID=UPI00164692F1|nr:hypothetical protein [Aquibacillus kalidii]
MKMISTENIQEEILVEFFEGKWEEMPDKTMLRQHGYLVEYQEQYKAYFALAPVKGDAFWLKSLYIKEGVPSSLPLSLIESAIAITRDKVVNGLFVYSHQQTLSSLLTLLGFKEQLSPAFADGLELKGGKWYKIEVNKVPQLKSDL